MGEMRHIWIIKIALCTNISTTFYIVVLYESAINCKILTSKSVFLKSVNFKFEKKQHDIYMNFPQKILIIKLNLNFFTVNNVCRYKHFIAEF